MELENELIAVLVRHNVNICILVRSMFCGFALSNPAMNAAHRILFPPQFGCQQNKQSLSSTWRAWQGSHNRRR